MTTQVLCSCSPQAPLVLAPCKAGLPRSRQRIESSANATEKSSGEQEACSSGKTKLLFRNAVCAVVSAATLALKVPDVADAVTPYAQSQSERLQIGLINGRIRSCPLDINPNCVSTSSTNQAYAFPWEIPASDATSAVKKIESAILGTQKNAQIVKVEDISDGKRSGKYLVAEVDGFLGRDTLEFLVRDDIVTYRSIANKVQYVYPFTTPLGDFGAQQKHIQALGDELGWLLPDFDTTR